MAQDYQNGIPFSPETAEEFFEQIDEWNNEDRYADCIRELEKALSIAGEEHAYRVAYLFARACQNAVYHDDSFPDEQKDILMQWTLSALDGVWDEGIDIPEWNMRIASSLRSMEAALSISLRKPSSSVLIDHETRASGNDAIRSISRSTRSDFVAMLILAPLPLSSSSSVLVRSKHSSSGLYGSVTEPMNISLPEYLSGCFMGFQCFTSRNSPHGSVCPVNLFMNEA